MKRILLTIAYDGTNYSGWQKQKDEAVITVEGELTKALRLLFRNPALECIGASRTDAGVHALGQRAVIDVETSIPAEKIPLAIRSFLPADIVVTKAEEVAETFHPRFCSRPPGCSPEYRRDSCRHGCGCPQNRAHPAHTAATA